MSNLEPGATLMGKYRIERLVATSDGVALWEATDLSCCRAVQLSVYPNGSTMLDIAQIDSGMLVVVDARTSHALPRLELVDVTSDEDAFFDEPPAPELFDDVPMKGPRRLWPWAFVAVVSLATGGGAFYMTRARAVAATEATLTEAVLPLPARTIEATPPPPKAPMPSAEPRATTAPRPSPSPPPLPKHPKPPPRRAVAPVAPVTPPALPRAPSDPLTL